MDNMMLSVVLPMVCPFPAAEKQALVEAPSLEERFKILQLILDMTGQMPDKGYPFGPL